MTDLLQETKHCRGCDTTKHRDEFYNAKREPDGKQPRCKACQKAYKAAHPEQGRKHSLRWSRANPEKNRARVREHYTLKMDKEGRPTVSSTVVLNRHLEPLGLRHCTLCHKDQPLPFGRVWCRDCTPQDIPGGDILAPHLLTPGYATIHRHLKAAVGYADAQTCESAGCGEQAAEWSYNNHCPDELISNMGYRYCRHTEHYRALCLSCHKIYDKAFRKALKVMEKEDN